ncbi:MAG: glycosyltransferase family 4 protein [Elusimicrobia bacterium]|nr:glycosyltransferase family 4 protein [Elusimicrobiota bacterium]
MKVLHIITRLEKGGSSKNVLYSLYVENFENFLICGPSSFSENINNEKGSIYEVSNLKREISLYRDIKAFFEIYSLIKKIKPDIIHTHTSKAGFLGRIAAFLYNFPQKKSFVIHTPHGHLFYGYYGALKTAFFKIIEKILSFLTDRYVALTESEKKESLREGLGKEEIWSVIHSGIEFPEKILSKKEAREKLSLSDSSFIFLFAGRLEKVKGPDIFIKIAEHMENKGYKNNLYLLLGEGSMRKELEKLCLKKNLSKKIIFLGHRENIWDYYAASDLLIQPSRNEAMGRTVLEAQYCGLPVLASDACGLADTVKDGGIIFKSEKIEEALSLAEKFYDNSFRQEKSRLAFIFARKKDKNGFNSFSQEAMNEKLKKLYSSLTF